MSWINQYLEERTVHEGKPLNVAATASVTSAAIAMAYQLYSRVLRKAARNCQNLPTGRKNECMAKHKIHALSSEVSFLKGRLSSCSRTPNAEKCRRLINERINKKEKSIEKWKKIYSKIGHNLK